MTEEEDFLANVLTSFTAKERKGWMDYYRRIEWYNLRCGFCNKTTGVLCSAPDSNNGPEAIICGDCYDRHIKRR